MRPEVPRTGFHPEEAGFGRIRLPAWVVWPVALTGVCWVAVGDYMTGADVTFTLLYLGPIAFAIWFGGRLPGLVTSIASAAAWFAMDLLTRAPPMGTSVRLWNLGGQLGVFLLFAVLLENLRDRLHHEHRLARTDELTGLPNRRAFRELLEGELEQARRYRRPLSVASIDCDGFKQINDRYGHERGDAVLCAIARVLRERTRRIDSVGRMGGDEFAIVLPHTDADTARALLERLREEILEAAREPEFRGVSVGALTFLGPPPDPEELLRRTDALMYVAKRGETGGFAHEVVGEKTPPTLSLAS